MYQCFIQLINNAGNYDMKTSWNENLKNLKIDEWEFEDRCKTS